MASRTNSIVQFIVCVISAAVLSTQAHAQNKVSLSIAHIATLNVPNVAATVGALKTALEATGKVDLTLYGQGSSYSDPRQFSDLVRRGVVDIALGSPQFEPGRFPLNTLIGEPFIASDHIAATRALRTVFLKEPSLQKECTNEVTKGHLEVNSVMTPNNLLINEDKYASLPPEVKKVIDDFSTEQAAIRFAEAWSKTDKLGREGAIAKNATIVTLSDKERLALRALSAFD